MKKPISDIRILKFTKGKADLEIYSLTAPEGFTCLGDAVTRGGKPDLNRYCCVRNDLLIDGDSYFSTNLRIDGKEYNVRLPRRKDNTHEGIVTSTFKVQKTNFERDFPIKMIRNGLNEVAEVLVEESWDPVDDNFEYKPLLINEMSELEKIDVLENKDTEKKVSIWRTKQVTGYFRIGDMISIGDRNPDIGKS